MNRNIHIALLLSLLRLRSGCAQQQTVTGDADEVTAIATKLRDQIAQIFDYNPTAELVFVLDSSGSVGADNYQRAIEFIHMTSTLLSVSSSATRVSVVSYSECYKIYVYIDYITTPGGKNKCTFLDDLGTVAFDSGYTCTGGGLEKAGEILSRSRSGAVKVIMVLTDGESNRGRDVATVAKELKDQGIIIFSIGLGGNIKEPELDAMATSVENHKFLLENLVDVRNFGDTVKADVHDYNSDYDDMDSAVCNSICSGDGNCCDREAACSCATRSGSIVCACGSGFTGSGYQCGACPRGTYKDSYGNGPCTSCPRHSTTNSTQSTMKSDCRCETGYQGDPGADVQCEPVRCPALNLGADSGVIVDPSNCGNTYGTECVFQCRDGYRKTGGADSTRCQVSRAWSADIIECQRITCDRLPDPPKGQRECDNDELVVGTSCEITCEDGYQLKKPELSRVTCQKSADGSSAMWSAEETECKKIPCPAIAIGSPTVTVNPKPCQNTPEFDQVCVFECKDGYDVDRDMVFSICMADGTWSQPTPDASYCRDVLPPEINCPADIKQETEFFLPTRVVLWVDPDVSDNSGIAPMVNSTFSSPHRFSIGDTVVRYTATDATGNVDSCSFTVTIIDNETPRTSCTADVVKQTFETEVAVDWNGSDFFDNSGTVVVTPPTSLPGSIFSIDDGIVPLSYTATDPSGNNATCDFEVTLTRYNCPYYPPPINGVVACETWLGGQFCAVQCNKKYTFTKEPEPIYNCAVTNDTARWVSGPSSDSIGEVEMPWPDCTGPEPPKSVDLAVSVQYFPKRCPKAKAMQTIRANLVEQFEQLARSNALPEFCDVSTSCTVDNVELECGEITKKRKRRQAGGGSVVLTISFTVSVAPSEDEADQANASAPTTSLDPVESLNMVVSSIQDQVSAGNLTLTVDNEVILPSPETFLVDPNPTISCDRGSIPREDKCLPCTPGTFEDEASESCQRCPIGYYQTDYGQTSCVRCPEGTSTSTQGAISSKKCRSLCSPGSFSDSGVESCSACPEGYFEPGFGSRSCTPCPDGLTTWTPGAKQVDDCTDACRRGYFSETGFAPCTACPKGTYQPNRQEKSCMSCPDGLYTHRKGAHAIQYCQVIDECVSDPCSNGATCVDIERGFRCVCPAGFTGSDCDVDINECFGNNVCLNNATCVDMVNDYECHCQEGFTGDNCEINIDDCVEADCRYGATCIDGIAFYTCQCVEGFAGEHCEINLFDCASDPCQNGASCIDLKSNFTCCCVPGYTGRFCEKIQDYCRSNPCYGNATCSSTTLTFNCACPPGFEGRTCEVDTNECVTNDVICQNGGTCEDLVNEYRCNCPLGFTDDHCERELSSDFDLNFPSAITSNKAQLSGILPDLYEFTFAFWMKTSDTTNSGTPISYAVRGVEGEEDMDNALTLQDYNNFVLSVNEKIAFTYVAANRDSDWHFIAVTWTSETGDWHLYIDGNVGSSGTDLSRGTPIRGRGLFVVGQEQDSYGGSYVAKESFVGTISQVNVWDYAMDLTEIRNIAASCSNSGNALSWAQLSTGVEGAVVFMSNSQICGRIDDCRAGRCQNGGTCVDSQSGTSCRCPSGSYGTNCEHQAQECPQDVQCRNGGSCTGSGTCVCESGFSGSHCQIAQACADQRCEHDGVCVIQHGEATCFCPDGYTGRRCQFDVDECSVHNGGCDHNCHNSQGSFSCSCQTGFALQPDGKTCYDVSFCKQNGKFHSMGDSWTNGCATCRCFEGRANCSTNSCPPLSCSENETVVILPGVCCPSCLPETRTCSVDDFGLLTTFDGYSFTRRGECRYVLTQDCGGDGNFEVHVEHTQETVNGRNYFRGISLFIYVDCVQVQISHNGTVYVLEEPVTLPYLHQNPQNLEIIATEGSGIEVITNKGLFVTWNQTSGASVRLTTNYKASACGLCGNLNADKKDDKLTRQFIKSRSSKELLHSWKVDGYKHCKKVEVSSSRAIRFGNIKADACAFLSYIDFLRARSKCSIFNHRLFRACHGLVHPTGYYEVCLEDACTCGVNDPCHCESISAYANECERRGLKISGWKDLTSCNINCPPSMIYDDCGPACRPTCSDPRGRSCPRTRVSCVSGCQCPAGKVEHGGRCISEENCPAR